MNSIPISTYEAHRRMRIAIAGTGLLGYTLLDGCSAAGHDIVAYVADGRKTPSFRRAFWEFTAAALGGSRHPLGWVCRRGIPRIWLDSGRDDPGGKLARIAPDLLLVGGFGIIFKAPLLTIPRLGCVNVHCALLPRHRGPNPFAAAILSGDKESGVTFHQMEETIDSGPILAQRIFPLHDEDTSMTVYQRACEVVRAMLPEVLADIEMHGLRGIPQDPAHATYDPLPTPDQARIVWNMPASHIHRMVRALPPMLYPWFTLNGKKVFVAKTELFHEHADIAPGTVLDNRLPVRVATGSGILGIRVAYALTPLPGLWPLAWHRVANGTRLE